jgi:hypothetical protein
MIAVAFTRLQLKTKEPRDQLSALSEITWLYTFLMGENMPQLFKNLFFGMRAGDR